MAKRASLTRLHVFLLLAADLYIQVLQTAAWAQDDLSVPGLFGPEGGMTALDFDSARMSFFSQADRNGDFSLSQDELAQGMAQGMAQGGARMFDGYDGDGDGLISYDEYIQSGNDLFLSLDTDGDGILTSMEI